MGLFKIKIGIGFQKNGNLVFPEQVEALVDTGATYTTLPAELLNKIGIKPVGNISVKLADGSVKEKQYGGVWLNINGLPISATILFGDKDDIVLVGATSLEQAGVVVDPVNKRLMKLQSIQA